MLKFCLWYWSIKENSCLQLVDCKLKKMMKQKKKYKFWYDQIAIYVLKMWTIIKDMINRSIVCFSTKHFEKWFRNMLVQNLFHAFWPKTKWKTKLIAAEFFEQFIPNKQTVNSGFYIDVSKHLRYLILWKRPEIWENGLFLHHDTMLHVT